MWSRTTKRAVLAAPKDHVGWRRVPGVLAVAVAVGAVGMVGGTAAAGTTFLGGAKTISTVGSTVPGNGDVNPYGVAVISNSTGRLVAGDVLVSNFNNKGNLQGTGTTIVEVSPMGTEQVFAHIGEHGRAAHACGGVGLTTALAVLHGGWVVVGSLPTTDGSAATATAGCLFVLDSQGRVVRVIHDRMINGPWDMTAVEHDGQAALFVTNVLNGTVAANGRVVNGGTVVRISLDLSGDDAPRVRDETVIGSGFGEHSDPAALVVGPTGVALAPNGTLYVADTANNRIAAIPDAVERHTSALAGNDVTANGALSSPLGLTIAPNGDILTVNGGDGNAVETTPGGNQVAMKMLDSSGMPPGAGALFGLAVAPDMKSLYFVDDATNTLNLLH
jgi:hypothetical protein